MGTIAARRPIHRRRATYVIDPEGVIRHRFNSQMKAAQHIPEALEAIRSGTSA